MIFYLQIDREYVPTGPIPFLSFSDTDEMQNMAVGDNEVQIGGVNTSDPRFGSYKSYSGCLSSKNSNGPCLSLIHI